MNTNGYCRTVIQLYILEITEIGPDWAILFDLLAVPRLLPGTPDALRGDVLYPGHIKDSVETYCTHNHVILSKPRDLGIVPYDPYISRHIVKKLDQELIIILTV